MDYSVILEQIFEEVQEYFGKGKVANYIPALSKINPKKLGISICTVKGKEFSIGDAEEAFSIQSISKVISLTIAMQLEGNRIWSRVGREPSGTKFNSLIQLEYENGIPRNPFINAGAIVITDIISTPNKDTKIELLQFIQNIINNENLQFDMEVAKSEKDTGYRNAALANFLKSFNNLNNKVEDVLNTYYHQCSIHLNCKELSQLFLYLANGGKTLSGHKIISLRQAKRINSLMLTCGLYDAVGDFAYRVGLPAKSGVGGGIISTIPGELCISVWSPELNRYGNSLVGTKVLELFTTYTGLSIF